MDIECWGEHPPIEKFDICVSLNGKTFCADNNHGESRTMETKVIAAKAIEDLLNKQRHDRNQLVEDLKSETISFLTRATFLGGKNSLDRVIEDLEALLCPEKKKS